MTKRSEATTQDLAIRVSRWMAGGDTVISSVCIAQTALGNYDVLRHAWPPADPSDLGRCLRLLKLIPELRDAAFPRLRYDPQWAKLIAKWDELAAMMEEEVGIDWSKGGSAPKTYKFMQELGL
jgi:hypothetical protein